MIPVKIEGTKIEFGFSTIEGRCDPMRFAYFFFIFFSFNHDHLIQNGQS